MKFGIAFANTGPFTDPVLAVEFAQAAEAAGFESLWTVEHVIVPSAYESAYPYDPSGATLIRRILPRRSLVLPAPRRESRPGFIPGASLFGAKPLAPGVLAGVLSPVAR